MPRSFPLEKTRNIGIMAHIDAGKKTTTEAIFAYINKMARTGADFFNSVQTMTDRLGANPLPIQLPIGSEDNFKGVVDLIEMKGLIWTDELGAEYETVDVPDDLKDQAEEYRTQ